MQVSLKLSIANAHPKSCPGGHYSHAPQELLLPASQFYDWLSSARKFTHLNHVYAVNLEAIFSHLGK